MCVFVYVYVYVYVGVCVRVCVYVHVSPPTLLSQRSAVCFLDDCVFSTAFEPKDGGDAAEKLRRMSSLVLRAGSADFISNERLPLLLDGSDDARMKGVRVVVGGSGSRVQVKTCVVWFSSFCF